MKRIAVFLDRDGVINKEVNYLHKIKDFKLERGALQGLKKLSNAKIPLIIITNQAGIARGYYKEKDYHKLMKYIINFLRKKGIKITAHYFCPHHPTEGIGKYRIECKCRKPNIGLFKKAARIHNIDLKNSFYIGDKTLDIKAGRNAGCKTILVLTGYAGRDGEYKTKPDYKFKDLNKIADFIMSK